MHVYGEAIAAARYQLDVRLTVWLTAERLSQGLHVLRQVRVIDERLRPQCLHQLAFAHDPVVVVCEQQQQIEGLPQFRKSRMPLFTSSAYGEGWGLYEE